MPSTPGTERRPTPARRWWALVVLASVQFMIVANITIVNVALPSVQADLRLTSAGLAWVVNAYLLASGGVLLLGGRLGDLLGRRRMLVWGALLFAAASAAASAAQGTVMLVASRFAQGLGVALAAPCALALVAVLFPAGRDRARALAVWGGLGALGSVAGLLLSGLLTGWVSWRWVFLVNLPVAVVALALLPRLVPESHAPGGRLDLAGAVLVTGGLVAVVAGLLGAASRPWGDPGVLGPLLGGLAALVAFVLAESRTPDPLLPLRFFASPVPAAFAAFTASAAGLALLGRVSVDGAYAADLLPGMLLLAAGLGLGLPALQTAALHGSAAGEAGLAGGVITCVQQLGAAAGLSVLATLAFRRAAARSGSLGAQAAAVAGYRLAFQVAALVLAAGAVLVLFMRDRVHPPAPPTTEAPAPGGP